MIRPKIKWSSLEARLERIERATSPQRYVFVITVPYEQPSEERLGRTYAQMRDEYGYVPNRDLFVLIDKFCCDDEELSEEAYELLVHKMVN